MKNHHSPSYFVHSEGMFYGFSDEKLKSDHDWTKLLYNSVVVDLLKPSVDASERCKLQ